MQCMVSGRFSLMSQASGYARSTHHLADIDSSGCNKSASEVFQKIMTQMLEDITGAEVIIDDILVWGSTI